MKTLDKILLSVAIFDVLFVIMMIFVFWVFQSVPDVLIVAVMGATFGECGCCSYIWKNKQIYKKGEQNGTDNTGINSANHSDSIDIFDTTDQIEG